MSGRGAALAEIVEAVLANPGLRAKAEIGLVGEVLGQQPDWLAGPGDDGAVVTAGGHPGGRLR